jgi:dihydroceramidase
MAIVGFLGIILHPWAEKRFKMAFLATCIVGLGSVAFHGTLSKVSQALDEVPMLYSALSFLYITLNQRYKFKKSTRTYLAVVLLCHAAITTYLVTAFEGHWQFFLFHISFGTSQVFAVYQVIRLYRKLKKLKGSSPATSILERGLAYYCVSFVCWLADMLLCEFVNPYYETAVLPFNPQFHALWHILISLGVYNMALFLLWNRISAALNGKKPEIKQILWLIDYITVVDVKKSRKQYSTF